MGRIFIGDIPIDYIPTDKDALITNNKEVDNLLSLGVGCIILTDVNTPIFAKTDMCCLISVKTSLYKTSLVIMQAVSLSSIMMQNRPVTFSDNIYLEEIERVLDNLPTNNFPVLNASGEILGIVSSGNIGSYNKKNVILIDHNEKDQSVNGIEHAKILEIIDHHRFSNIHTDEPLLIRAEPVGCSATIVYKMYKENNVRIEKSIAGLLLSAIISDTLAFASPTCTEDDQKIGLELARIAEINVEKFGTEILKASASLEGYSVKDILALDRKKFKFGSYTAYISQVNTYDYKSLHGMKEEIIASMEAFADNLNSDLVILLVTDIGLCSSELIACGREIAIVEELFGMKTGENSVFLPNVLSRKKQIVPILSGSK
jgi:manganese-dependent inorganic pyrophosphatase